MSKITIVPAGQWGKALSVPLQDNNHDVIQWNQGNDYLKVKEAEYIVLAPPSSALREVAENCLKVNPTATYISVTKGLESESLLRPSQVLGEMNSRVKFAVLSGPSFANEVATRLPTAVTVASTDQDVARKVQQLFSTQSFRPYVTDDVIGVELGGVLKNIIALAAGIADGIGCGDNARAALITRGFKEMVTLAVAEGANERTLFGLSGLGDLILTATSKQSRNYSVGLEIGNSGKYNPSESTTVEGLHNAELVFQLSRRHNLELNLCSQLALVVAGEKDPQSALKDLMNRPLNREY